MPHFVYRFSLVGYVTASTNFPLCRPFGNFLIQRLNYKELSVNGCRCISYPDIATNMNTFCVHKSIL